MVATISGAAFLCEQAHLSKRLDAMNYPTIVNGIDFRDLVL